jgi:hypothetical protein
MTPTYQRRQVPMVSGPRPRGHHDAGGTHRAGGLRFRRRHPPRRVDSTRHHDLLSHRCINLRGGSARPYRWEFEKNGEAAVVDVSGPLIFDDADLMIRAAMDGLGLTFSFEDYVAPQIATGTRARAGRLVLALRGLFPLPSEPATAVARPIRSHRDASPVACVSSGARTWSGALPQPDRGRTQSRRTGAGQQSPICARQLFASRRNQRGVGLDVGPP